MGGSWGSPIFIVKCSMAITNLGENDHQTDFFTRSWGWCPSYRVSLNLPDAAADAVVLFVEMAGWLETYVSGEYKVYGNFVFFTDEQDAMLFFMTWG